MRKVLSTIIILLIVITAVSAQNDSTRFIQKIQGGMIIGTSANAVFSGVKQPQPFNLGYYLLANITIVTPITYHNLMYGFGNNSLKVLIGYFLSKDKKWDAYLVYSKVMSANQNNLTFGIEKMLKAEEVKYFLYSELGTDFKGTETLSFGVRVSLQNIFWE